jgi:hypothetical protein
MLMFASCDDGSTGPAIVGQSPGSGQTPLERKSHDVVGPSSMCVYTIASSAEPLDVFDLTAANGGRTCYRQGRRTAFLPPKNLACSYEAKFDLELEEIVSIGNAEEQFRICTALTNQGMISEETEAAIISHNRGSTPQGEQELYLFDADLRALVTNGALLVNNFQSGLGIICLDTDQPDALRAQIAASSTVSDDIIVETRKSDCKTVMQILEVGEG